MQDAQVTKSLETQLVSFSLLNGFALKKGPPLYVKFVIFANFSYGKEFHF